MATRTKRSAKRRGTKAKAAARPIKPPIKKVQPIPPAYQGITPYLTLRDTAQALVFYQKAFGAKETARLTMPDGKIMHAEMKVFDQVVMLTDEAPGEGRLGPESLKGSPVSLMVYARDVDAAMARAVAAGATVKMAAQDMFWGDRFGTITDPFGHGWGILTHKEDVTPREMEKRWQAMRAKGPA